MIRHALALALISLAIPTFAQSASSELSPVGRLIQEAMDSEHRSEADRARDANRKPIETLEFLGLKPDMKVLELLPGGGWYTQILGHVLRDDGELYVSIGTSRIEESLLKDRDFRHVKVAGQNGTFQRDGRRFSLGDFKFDVENVDMVLTFRNMHNFTAEGRAQLNTASFEALAPGGLYGVVDHTRRHMAEDNYENWRRMDPVEMIKEIEAAGFEFVDFSDIHYRPDDELRYEVGRKTVTGNTDRFTLLFRKPS